MERACRVVLADHDTDLRGAVSRVLRSDPSFELVAQAGSAHDTVRLLHGLSDRNDPPDVVVLDLDFSDLDTSAAIAVLRSRFPDVLMVAHTISGEDDTRELLGDLLGYRHVQRRSAGALLDRLRSIRAGLITSE